MISPENLEPSIIKTLRNSGYRATPQRIAISKYVLRNQEHPTAQKAYLEVKKMHPTVSLATIYTTIRILKETGLILELNLPQGHINETVQSPKPKYILATRYLLALENNL